MFLRKLIYFHSHILLATSVVVCFSLFKQDKQEPGDAGGDGGMAALAFVFFAISCDVS